MSLNTGLKYQGGIPINAERLNTSSLNRIKDKSCVLALDFNNDTSDRSSYGNHGINNEATFEAGKIGNALSFDGSNDFVNCGVVMSVGADGSFSLKIWFKTSNTTASTRAMVDNYNAVAEFYGIFLNSAHKIVIQTRDSNDALITQTSAGTVNDGNWHYAAVSRDGIGNIIKAFLDGVEFSSEADTRTGDFTPSTNTHWIGKQSNGLFFPGTIDEVRIYNRALSAAEIYALYRGLN